jgi:glycine hydroxymethyltransferase
MNSMLDKPLSVVDPEIQRLINLESLRQFSGLELIASENFTSLSVMQANGSILTNKYSEGLPGARYYGGNQYIDQIETLCQERALKAFSLNDNDWSVNVQSYSGSTANFSVLTAMLSPHDRIMGLDLPSGGHLTHGYATAKKKISNSSIYFESMSYKVDMETGLMDYTKLEKMVLDYRPKMLICGASAYPRDWDYSRFRKIADSVGAILLADIAHISGLVATKEHNNPFEYCDVVTTTTHKTIRGPRAGLIFCKKEFKNQIDFAVFPSSQGGPHNNTIAAVAVALKQVMMPEFHEYIVAVKGNAKVLSSTLLEMGYKLVTDGTDNHIVLWDLRPIGLTGSKMENICDHLGITINKNAVHGDKSALVPGGVRLGTSALTSRNMGKSEFKTIAGFLDDAVNIALDIQTKSGKKLVDFSRACTLDSRIHQLKQKIQEFAQTFPMPGVKNEPF